MFASITTMRFGLLSVGVFGILLPCASRSADEPDQLDAVVVTGTRALNKRELSSASPVTVISGRQLAATGYSDLGSALQSLDPAINFPHAATTASSANTRPITLLGLAPDQVLVLINGKRAHPSAVLTFNNAVGRGSAPFDLNSIPLEAIQRIEVLKDGAAAQYGSDAIAGVVNIILDSRSSEGSVVAGGGVTDRGDGGNGDLSIGQGLRMGDRGHLTLTANGFARQQTNRAGVDTLVTPARATFQTGDPRSTGQGFVADAGLPIGADGDLYASFIGTQRDSTNPAQYRAPTVSPLYPQGFVPQISVHLADLTGTLGYRFTLGKDYDLDVSNTSGSSRANFQVNNSVNTPLGPTSPLAFDGGSLQYRQNVTAATVSHSLDGVLAGGNIAAGLEYRHESYAIGRGSLVSYTGAGSQGFPGLNPRIPVDTSRNASSAFVDAELDPVRWLQLGAALRYDHYGDFGGATTGKLSARAELSDALALRASGGTGFRAPSLQQEFFSSVTSASSNGTLVNVGTFQVGDPVARALGATPLKAERSRNASVGLVFAPFKSLSITADAYRIDVDDRIVLSEQLSGNAVQAVLRAAGITDVQQAQFFTNAAKTSTKGVQLTATYRTRLDDATRVELSTAFGAFHTRLKSLATNEAVPGLPLLGTRSVLLLTDGQPNNKLTSTLALDHGPYGGNISVTRYGSYTGQPVTLVQKFGAKAVVDLSAHYSPFKRSTVSVGILNIGNVYPDQISDAIAQNQGLTYGEESPWGINGRAYYARLRVGF